MNAIWWIRRDLRLKDNPALRAAIAHGAKVIPLFIIDPRLNQQPYHRQAERRRQFLYAGLHALAADLQKRGSRLIVRQGRPHQVLAQVLREAKANAIFAEEDFSPYAQRRDQALAKELPLQLVSGLTVHHPLTVLKPDGKPYTVFTPFSKTWRKLALPTRHSLLAAPQKLSTPKLKSLTLPPANLNFWEAGEATAHKRLRKFAKQALSQYEHGRNEMDRAGTSTLSPYLRLGMISARTCVVTAREMVEEAEEATARAGGHIWINELIWREFYISVLYHFPQVLREAFNPKFRKIKWRNNPQELRAWQTGQTGYPIVDAGMRQLQELGWMHNRARMIVASFLVKDLLIDWREGEQWFAQHLIDGDPAANNGGWQWTAGVGTDAAPYFRIFNPILQSKKFDPQGTYIKRYVPELKAVPVKFIHTPWEMPIEIQRQAQCVIGIGYPQPLVDHAVARARTLKAFAP